MRGKGFDAVTVPDEDEDHPRVCGEKYLSDRRRSKSMGSPPRMRGKVCTLIAFGEPLRITPAYAGKSLTCWKKSHGIWDHPRVCGEKVANSKADGSVNGSPPRMRGKDPCPTDTVPQLGITPAYAGKSVRLCWLRCYSRDHPRVCGEKSSAM